MRILERAASGATPAWPGLMTIVAGLLLLAGQAAPAAAQQGTADEYEIRAAMLLNLTKFIEWPPAKFDAVHPQFVVCIFGSDPIQGIADRFLQNQTVAGKPLLLKHLASLDGAGSCHILYVGTADRAKVEKVLPELMKNGVLTVSERSNDTSPSQVVGLPIRDEHVHIDVNLGVAQRTGLTISSKLLRVATVTR